ncbi:maspardin [Pyrus ussuriensis x Pyrus communis]|uniref:Maspardin n=1 Tax=Pyrus ussuriensis x Pyrus communis TaxID=2448454 RepID=A0A5N5H8S9_9ROSA|nr:maspardin [Pyrus ussuriensis x Pyrus communis]
MKGVYSAPGDYIYFKSQVPLHKIPIGTKQWRYYDFGPKAVPPLICLPGTAGTADVCYKQIMSLSMKGYRVISVDIPRVWNHHEWILAFEKFLDAIDVHHIHIYGTSLGGFLAQLFAQHRPRRVRSLILSNTFLDTRSFSAAMPWAPVISWTPSFLLKRYVLTGIHDGPHEPFIADSVDFVVSQVETLSREDLASRLTLTTDAASVGPLLLTDSFITIMDTNDYSGIPQQLKDEVGERYPDARRAQLKSGGDFPFLSRPDEVNLHLQLHLRRVGVEPRPDLVPGVSKGGGGSSSEENEKKDEKKDPEDPPKDDRGNPDNPFAETQLPPAPEGSESHSSDDQLVSNAKFCYVGNEDMMVSLPSGFLNNQHAIATEFVMRLSWEIFALHLHSYHVVLLYISLNCNRKLGPLV